MVKVYGYLNRPKLEGIVFTDPSMTQQQFATEADLNNIVDRNMRYKDPSFVTKLQLAGKMSALSPIYGDFSDVKDYQSSIETVRRAQDQFNSLPSKIRDRFNNDPSQMLEFCSNVSNYDEGVSLGLFEKNVEIEKHLHPELLVTPNLEEAGHQAVSTTVGETSAQGLT